MKMMFCSTSAYGHTYPLIPLAIAARDAGHEVVFATDPIFHVELKAFGLNTATVNMMGAIQAALGDGDDRVDFDAIAEMFGETLPRAVLDGLGPLLAEVKPDLVVHEAGCMGAFFAAKLAGIPGVCHGFGKVDGFVATDPAAPATTERLASFSAVIGVPYEGLAMGGGGDPYIDICPPLLQTPLLLAAPNRIPLRPVAVSLEQEAPKFLRERSPARPLVYLTLGTVFSAFAAGVLRGAIEGLAALDLDVLVATGPRLDPGVLGEVPDNVRLEAWVPQARVLPLADLVVHHGGSGTTLGGLAAGRSQLLLPQGADQVSNALAVTEVGAGAWLAPEEFSPEAVTRKARALLVDDGAREAARRSAAEIAAMPSPEETVGRLVQIADNHAGVTV